MSEYEDDFNKMYSFKCVHDCFLPHSIFKSQKWSIPELQRKKQELNEVKSLLGKYKLKVWSKHTANRDRAGFVIKKLSEEIKPELLTQAWCKFYEILVHFPVVPLCAVKNKKLESLHLCEAPGAFVCALNHYLILNYPGLNWTWNANTLNPNYEGNELSEMIPDDRFIRHTLENWVFGSDFSGDLTKFYNFIYLTNLKKESQIFLVTADGSVDCMSDPGEQEKLVERLHFCETVTALSILQPGGTFVLKIFTMFEETTINLLFLLTCLFENVSIFKPCTSKSGNSELYVVNTKFKGFNLIKTIWPNLLSAYEDINIFNSNSMFALAEIPQTFLSEIHKCSDFFMKKQVLTILDNIHNFEHKSYDNIYMIKSFIAQIYVTKYALQPIRDDLKIVPNVCVAENWRIYSTKRTKNINYINVETINKKRGFKNILNIVIGKKINTAHNSKFTHNNNLQKVVNFFYRNTKPSHLYSHIVNLLRDANNIINIYEFNNYQSLSIFQKQFFEKLFASISKEKNIILVNIPFITHFLAGLLYLLFFVFDKVYIGNGIVFLGHPKKCNIEDAINLFTQIHDSYRIVDQSEGDFDKDIVQIVSPTLFEHGYFIEKLWNYNNQLFYEDKCFLKPLTYLIR